MSPAEITEWDKAFRAWAPLDPGPQRRRRVELVKGPLPPRSTLGAANPIRVACPL